MRETIFDEAKKDSSNAEWPYFYTNRRSIWNPGHPGIVLTLNKRFPCDNNALWLKIMSRFSTNYILRGENKKISLLLPEEINYLMTLKNHEVPGLIFFKDNFLKERWVQFYQGSFRFLIQISLPVQKWAKTARIRKYHLVFLLLRG